MNNHRSLLLLLGVSFIAFLLHSCALFDNTSQGELLYKNFCSSCHMDDGAGLKNLYPTLVKSDYLDKNQDRLSCIIRYGLNEEIQVNGKSFSTPMAAIPQLNEVEMANVINYIMKDLNGQEDFFISPTLVSQQLNDCKE